MHDLQVWLAAAEGPIGYLALALASLAEYIFPPFPGDSVSLLGVFLAVTAGYSVIAVYSALNLGGLAGGMIAYSAGRFWRSRRPDRTPRFLRTQQARQALDRAVESFDRHGAAYLLFNRFVPVIRGFFFVGAGLAGLPAWRVALFGGLGACLYNGVLLLLGWVVGDNLALLQEVLDQAGYASLVVLLLVGALVFFRWRRSRLKVEPEVKKSDSGVSSKGPRASDSSPEDER